ncbi:fumarylacetoacetate hydrolase family protein [Alicyclobacillus fodiniaquatilis]|uniref:Fumarylacetoacetate hydrolase family protein n=1 Tax=Alicyclobacillus fodiniaquatilis TaxID=1661150 RepID=A0ABW4JCD3_9BACL
MKTIRYRDPQDDAVQLGLLEGDAVYSITRQVPQWTEPLAMWYALRALDVSPAHAAAKLAEGSAVSYTQLQADGLLLPPVVSPEVWAAGVTYERSREARNAETTIKDNVYDRVYTADRPELFFKATYARVVAPGKPLGLRSDSRWMVPEPELGLVLSAGGELVGWTVGNDLSSRDIEGENPLYLPQAKVFAKSCSFGPALLWNTGGEQPETWEIELVIRRDNAIAFEGVVSFSQFRRSFAELISYLRRDNPIQDGTVLLTGTGIVPPDDFTLQAADTIEIAISPIGVLVNRVEVPLEMKVTSI